MIYLNIQVVKGQRKVIGLLKEQISNVSAPATTPTQGPPVSSPQGPPTQAVERIYVPERLCHLTFGVCIKQRGSRVPGPGGPDSGRTHRGDEAF